MKTKAEILKFCKERCTRDSKCKGKLLKKAKKSRGFMGRTTTPKGEWYCSKP
jgi:hypothetical protein